MGTVRKKRLPVLVWDLGSKARKRLAHIISGNRSADEARAIIKVWHIIGEPFKKRAKLMSDFVAYQTEEGSKPLTFVNARQQLQHEPAPRLPTGTARKAEAVQTNVTQGCV